MVTLCLNFWGNARPFSKTATPILHFHQQGMKFSVSLHPCQQLLVLCLNCSYPSGREVVPHCGLIGISLMTNAVIGHCIFSGEVSIQSLCPFIIYLFFNFAFFLIGWLVFLSLSCKSFLYVLDTSPLSDIWYANVFSRSLHSFYSCWHPLEHKSFKCRCSPVYLFFPCLCSRCRI